MKRRSGHAATELIHNWSGSRDAMKCCAAINRVMTFTSGDGATHECNTTVTHFKGFMCIFQSHSGTVEANAHSNANCKHKALLLWAVWAIWVTYYCTLFFLLDALNVGDCCHSAVLHCFWKTSAGVPKSLLITVIFHCQYFFHVICIQHICSAQLPSNLQLPPVESAVTAI